MQAKDIGFSHCLTYSGFERKIYMLVIDGKRSSISFKVGWTKGAVNGINEEKRKENRRK